MVWAGYELSGDEQSRRRWSGQGMNCLEMNSPGTDGLGKLWAGLGGGGGIRVEQSWK